MSSAAYYYYATLLALITAHASLALQSPTNVEGAGGRFSAIGPHRYRVQAAAAYQYYPRQRLHCQIILMKRRIRSKPNLLRQTQEETNDEIDNNVRRYSNLPRLYTGRSITGDEPMSATATPAFGVGVMVQLSADQSHYLSNVIRIFKKKTKRMATYTTDANSNIEDNNIDISQCVRIFDGKSGEWLARVSAMQQKGGSDERKDNKQQQRRRRRRSESLSLSAECLLQLKPQGTRQLPWVFFAPIKKHRAKLMVEKCTELGAGLFVPIITDRTDPSAVIGCVGGSSSRSRGDHSSRQSMEGLEKLAIQALEASEQCERLDVPNVLPCVEHDEGREILDVETLLKNWCNNEEDRVLMICRERTSRNAILSQLRDNDDAGGVAFLVGPEGGWSPKEEELFDEYQAQSPMIKGISLGSCVLRAETASITCVAAWNLYRVDASTSD